jgi:hypothetical protein
MVIDYNLNMKGRFWKRFSFTIQELKERWDVVLISLRKMGCGVDFIMEDGIHQSLADLVPL